MTATLLAMCLLREACLYMLAEYQHFIEGMDNGEPSSRLQLINGCVMFLDLRRPPGSGYRNYFRCINNESNV